jgi:hypothetical protein
MRADDCFVGQRVQWHDLLGEVLSRGVSCAMVNFGEKRNRWIPYYDLDDAQERK